MKKLIKSIITAMLCAVIAISAVGTETVQAADTQTVKVTFNKKSVNFKVTDTGAKKVSYKSLKKKWGKPSYTDENEYRADYRWEKGKSYVHYTDDFYTPQYSYYEAYAEDKNVTVYGMKVGMKKSKAEKTLKSLGEVINEYDGGIQIKLADVTEYDYSYITCHFENGKVSDICIKAYISQ